MSFISSSSLSDLNTSLPAVTDNAIEDAPYGATDTNATETSHAAQLSTLFEGSGRTLHERNFGWLPLRLKPAIDEEVLSQPTRDGRAPDWSISPALLQVLHETHTPWGEVGYLTYLRTYSREHLVRNPLWHEGRNDAGEAWVKDGAREDFAGTVLRVILACRNQLGCNFSEAEEVRFARHLLQLKGSVAGRFWWQLGTRTVQRLGLLSAQNCSFTTIDAPVEPFCWTFDSLMLGVGVGFSVERQYIAQLPPVAFVPSITRDETSPAEEVDFLIPDSREGWIEFLRRVLQSHFEGYEGSGKSWTYSSRLVRGKGEPIRSFGGVASGPEPLIEGIDTIRDIIALCHINGGTLSSVNVLDMVTTLGKIVVSGNVRRCLPAGALVHSGQGLVPIEEISVGGTVLTGDGSMQKVANTFKQGSQEVFKVWTQEGYFEATPNHRMAVLKDVEGNYEWKEIQHLVEGDRLISPRFVTPGKKTTLPEWSYEKVSHSTTCRDLTIPELDEDMAWFLGAFQGDGYVYTNYANNGFNAYISLVFGADEIEIAERAQAQLLRFNPDLNVTLKKRKGENSLIVNCVSKQLSWYLGSFLKQAKTPLNVPECILQSEPIIRMAFLAGVADSDGALGNKPCIIASTVYPLWGRQLQTLLSSCGIESRLNLQKKQAPSRKDWQPIHVLCLITKRSKKLFSEIPCLIKNLPQKNKCHRSNGYPTAWFTSKEKTAFGSNSKQVACDRVDEHFGEKDIIPVRVERVEFSRVTDTYDIEVENRHEFFCDGLLTHNSALLCIGDADDIPYLKAKRWDLGPILNARAMSNNSVACSDLTTLPDEFWQTYQQGEPYGIINLDLMRKCGRIGETHYLDENVTGANPCQPAFATVLTPEGIATFGDIGVGSVIWSREGWTTVVKKWSMGIKPVYKYSCHGGDFVGTENHRVETSEGMRQVKDALDLFALSRELNAPVISQDELHEVLPEEDEHKYCYYSTVEEMIALGQHEVFDITVDNASHTYWTGGVSVSNCVEQSLENRETCALAESFLPNCDNKEEFLDVVTLLYRAVKHSLSLPCHLKETEAIVHKNMRMGIGITGVLQRPVAPNGEARVDWLDPTYRALRAFDVDYSAQNGFPVSKKLTTTKPSGSLSLLAGCTPGIHPNPAGPQYIRRIRIAAGSPLIETCRAHGYDVEPQRNFDGSEDPTTMVASFPCDVGNDTPVAQNYDAITQLEKVVEVQRKWSDNGVSVTVYYTLEELPRIRQWLDENYADNLKAVSFLLQSGHGFDQAPYETISEQRYYELKAGTRPITSARFDEADIAIGEECAQGGACPVR